ncbi:hypothetical protein HPB47_012803 [Ixodes persulcatus]|uniref:Uncharacterized protein n=1 Tax=Ixodes persulcatus TaxID=34615 RepID=A0AC60NSH7_IXOPE|nr:hypothetical protein HPB47_012803 [Ixodes persulcatus]
MADVITSVENVDEKPSADDSNISRVTNVVKMSSLGAKRLMFGHSRKQSDSTEFKEMSKVDAQTHLAQELEKLCLTASAAEREVVETEFRGFQKLFQKYIKDMGPSVNWEHIQPLPADAHLNRTYNSTMPLVLMNSFNTDEDTSKVLRKYKGFPVKIYTFLQSRYPRINKETLMPIASTLIDPEPKAFYPPGHGDFYASFCQSGLLEHFLSEGREFCFISNIDNLGATVDLNILNLLLSTNTPAAPDFVMEVTDKTRADVKGGTLIQYENRLRLLEIAQVPKENIDEFKSVKKFKIFNTNNLWMKLSTMSELVQSSGIDMEVIVNQKTLETGVNVIQLETAAGAAMKDFSKAVGINVPRSRFLPVKKTSDLLLVMSNLYHMKFGTLLMSPKRTFPTVPLIKLGDNHFAKVREFLQRFASIPDILELDHLTVSGDVTFGKGVSLRGTVIIIANHGDRIDIPASAVLENKIVSGNLRILDH